MYGHSPAWIKQVIKLCHCVGNSLKHYETMFYADYRIESNLKGNVFIFNIHITEFIKSFI